MTDLSSEEFRRVEEVFSEIADLDGEARRERLTRLEREEPRIAAEVRRVLDYDEEETIGGPGGLVGAVRDSAGAIGDSIGPYKLIEVIGEGGMGIVYLAEQEVPVRRRVALKLVKVGMDTAAVVARFDAERQSLALMSHPHIAQVFDAGATDSGRPYFVMEYAPGASLTCYCNEKRASTRERIDLFLDVCDAVQHAHQKGVIHRDLTASNVLVTEVDGKPQVKIIDFGIAKATDAREAQRTMFTEVGQVIGTPEYMSPEQADLSSDVDTRTDVYSLGVLLFELLTGQLPFRRDSSQRSGIGDLLRAIRDAEPPRPSSISASLRGDLDWITLRALAKDRDDRYDSVSTLGDDLRRHLANEPVVAGPPTTGYRLGKFVKRNKVGVIAAGLVLAALVAGTVGTTIGLLRAQAEAARAERESESRSEVIEFMRSLLATADTSSTGEELTAREMIDRSVEQMRERFGDDRPLTQAIVLDVVGDVYRNLHEYELARPLLEESLELRRAHLPEISDGVWESEIALGRLYREVQENEAATEHYTRCLEIAEARWGADSVKAGDCLTGLGILAWRIPDYEQAEAHLRRAYDINASQDPPDYEGMGAIGTNLAILQGALENYDASLASSDAALASYLEFVEPDSPRLAGLYNTRANTLVNLERYDEAVESYDRAIAMWTTIAPDHPNIGRAEHNIGFMYAKRELFEESLPHYRRALEIKRQRFGDDNTVLMSTLYGLSRAHEKLEQWQHALDHADELVRVAAVAHGEYSVPLGNALVTRSRALRALGRDVEAGRELDRAGSIAEATDNEELAENVAEERTS